MWLRDLEWRRQAVHNESRLNRDGFLTTAMALLIIGETKNDKAMSEARALGRSIVETIGILKKQ